MRGPLVASVVFLFVALTSATACTVVSGIDGYNVKKGGPAGDGGEGGGDGSSSSQNPTAPPPGTGDAAPPPTTLPPSTCGSEGSWTDCDPTPTVTTCADACRALGHTCVESCCMYDDQGDFPAQAGLVYAVLTSECSMSSLPNNSSWGLCSDPPVLAASGFSVRCCCR